MKLITKVMIGIVILMGLLGLIVFGLYQYNDGQITGITVQCNLSGGRMHVFSTGAKGGTNCSSPTRDPGYNPFSDTSAYTQAFTAACDCGSNRCWDNKLDKCVDNQ